jgi:hypothetical protein
MQKEVKTIKFTNTYNKGTKQARRYNSKCICTEHQCFQVHNITLLSMKEQIGTDKIIVGDLNTPLSSISQTIRQKLNQDILEHTI